MIDSSPNRPHPLHGEYASLFPSAVWDQSEPEAQGVDSQQLAGALEYLESICGPVGVSETVLIRNGFILWQGDAVNRRHTVWSCTKSFLSTCLGLLWDDAKCSPATLAWNYFPELEKDYSTITLEHLATFTSGYGCAENEPLKPLVPNYPPGKAFHYSAQSDLLAAILTRIAGEPLENLFMRRLGRKIGLDESSFFWTWNRIIDGMRLHGGSGCPSGHVECSALGIARLGWLFCNYGKWAGEQLISPAYIEYASSPRVSPAVPPYEPGSWYTILPGSYGLNWWVNGTTPQGQRMWPNAPASTFAAQGYNNNICFIVPEWNMVIVRLGGDKIIDTNLYEGMFARIKEGLELDRSLEECASVDA